MSIDIGLRLWCIYALYSYNDCNADKAWLLQKKKKQKTKKKKNTKIVF